VGSVSALPRVGETLDWTDGSGVHLMFRVVSVEPGIGVGLDAIIGVEQYRSG